MRGKRKVTTGIGGIGIIIILEVIMQLSAAGLTIVMASHFPDHAFLTAQQAAILKDQRVIALGTPDTVITSPNLKDAYGVDVQVVSIGELQGRTVCVPLNSTSTIKQ